MSSLTYARSTGYIRGLARGYHLAGRSLWRRLFLHLLLCSILWGASVAMLSLAAEVFFKNVTGQTVQQVVVAKWQGWWRVHPKGGQYEKGLPLPQK